MRSHHDFVAMAERSLAMIAHVCDVSLAARAIDAARSDQQRAVVHGDLNFPNVLWSSGAITGIVDFDQIGVARPLEELAWVVKWWARGHGIGNHWPDAALACAVVDGYGVVDDVRPLSAMLWLTGCLNANSVLHAVDDASAFGARQARAERLAAGLR